MMRWDKGPPSKLRKILERAPLDECKSKPRRFRLPWEPTYYRGRMNKRAKVLLIGQDPAASEYIAWRIFVGTTGQRVQGYLLKWALKRLLS